MIHQIRKAVIPAAVLGTRFLSATKASPKEMLPMLNYHMSSNFVDALYGLNLDHKDAELEFMVNWAPVAKKKTNYENRIKLSHEYYERLVELSNRIKSKHSKHYNIYGKVIKIESELDDDSYYYGKVTISYCEDGRKNRKQSMWVDKGRYDLAVEAHYKGLIVHVVPSDTIT